MSPEWVTVDDVIAINESVVAVAGEPHYIVNCNGLASAVDRPVQYHNWTDDGTEDDLVLLATKLCVGISQSQAFGQGNKRTAFVTMQMFLRQNGFNISIEGHNRIADLILGAAHPDRDQRLSDEDFAEGLDPFIVDLDHSIIISGDMRGSPGDLASISVALREAGKRVAEDATNAMRMNLDTLPPPTLVAREAQRMDDAITKGDIEIKDAKQILEAFQDPSTPHSHVTISINEDTDNDGKPD